MDPAFVVLWVTMAVLGGFLFAWASREDIRISSAVGASFVAIGLGLGNLLGNPLWPTLIATALTAGLAWACLEHYWWTLLQDRAIKELIESVHVGNHEHWIGSYTPRRETWSERLARWGFPSQQQMLSRGELPALLAGNALRRALAQAGESPVMLTPGGLYRFE